MELSERFIKQLESEDFANVYEWQDPAGTVYPPHVHKGKVSMMITDGSISFEIEGDKKEYTAGQRIDIPTGAEHSAIVGPEGMIVIVAEEIENDS